MWRVVIGSGFRTGEFTEVGQSGRAVHGAGGNQVFRKRSRKGAMFMGGAVRFKALQYQTPIATNVSDYSSLGLLLGFR